MNPISTYKKQFKNANDVLARDQEELRDVEEEIQELQKKKADISKKIEEDASNVVTKGILYYDSKKREQLLHDASQLGYSQIKIDKVRRFEDEDWNVDNVDFEIVIELQAMEAYVKDNLPDYTDGFLAKIGKIVCGGGDL